MKLDVTHLAGDLYIGGAPPSPTGYERFDVIVFCGEYQPDRRSFRPALVRRFPFDDDLQPSRRDYETALSAGSVVAEDLILQRRTLVTCQMGRNRSALVCAIALHLMTGEPATKWARHIRATRRDTLGVRALENPEFRRFLRTL